MERKYQYVKDSDGNLVRVSSGEKKTEYFCIECGGPMVFCDGKKVQKYFRHKNIYDFTNYEHSNETYLHKLAKSYYKEQMLNGKLDVNLKCVCDVEGCNGMSGLPREDGKCVKYGHINLMDYYEYVGTEVQCGKYKPDILLKNRKNGKELFFEVWVNHKCSEEKMRDNMVCEVKVSDDEFEQIPVLYTKFRDMKKFSYNGDEYEFCKYRLLELREKYPQVYKEWIEDIQWCMKKGLNVINPCEKCSLDKYKYCPSNKYLCSGGRLDTGRKIPHYNGDVIKDLEIFPEIIIK